MPVLVTGLGPISAVGSGVEEFWASLVAGRHGFGPVTLCDASRSPSRVAAEVDDFRLGDFVPSGRSLARRLPRPVQMGLAASALAIEDAGLDLDRTDRSRIGISVGTSLGNLGDGLSLLDRWRSGDDRPAAGSAFHLFNHAAACTLSAHFDLTGPAQTTSSGCNSGLDALGQALRLIQAGEVDAALVVGTDCEVVPEIFSLLAASGSLATRYNDEPGRASRPFDVDRDGNVLGEGAAALVLEAGPYARGRGARAYARVAGYALRGAGSRRYGAGTPEMDLEACERALEAAMGQAGWGPADIGAISANGSSSVHYDRSEARALANVFGDALPAVGVHSIKSMLGQHGAGSSALQAAAACLAIHDGVVPPTINHERLDPGCGRLRVVTEPERLREANILVNAIGFGGFYDSCGAFTAPPLT